MNSKVDGFKVISLLFVVIFALVLVLLLMLASKEKVFHYSAKPNLYTSLPPSLHSGWNNPNPFYGSFSNGSV